MECGVTRFSSRFGGLWIDECDPARIAERLSAIRDPDLRDAVRRFAQNGYVILPNAVPHDLIDAYLDEYHRVARQPGRIRMEVPTDGGVQPYDPARAIRPGSKVLDTAMVMPTGHGVTFAPAISRFLHAIFGQPALAFQTLHFEVGSTQAVHQDSAYVVVADQPTHLAASWIALEDIREGSGELIYYAGAHRIPDHPYAGGARKHWQPAEDGHPVHDAHLRYLVDEAAQRGIPLSTFRPRKGDALIWHADLPHGGSTITQPGSRRSLVSHYCPVSLQPNYLRFAEPDWQRKVPAGDGNAFCSMYYPPGRIASV